MPIWVAALSSNGSRAGQGRSGGYRMMIAFRVADRAVFLLGFAKNERDNIGPKELATLREAAAEWLAADRLALDRAVREELLVEVKYEN